MNLFTQRGIDVISLFDGMACGMIALIDAGIKVNRYVAFEINKYAVKTSLHNFPYIEHKGDVFESDFSEYKGFDLLIGGSPCTFWSVCQKQNRETEASGMGWELFSRYVDALYEVRPKYFIYENNKSMSASIRGSITEQFGFEPICINSSLVSAQHRQRLYWVGKRNDDGETYSKVNIENPKDLGISLKDILISNAFPINTTDREKSFAIKANYHKSSLANFVNGGGHYPQTGAAEPIRVGTWPNKAKNQSHDSQQYRIYSIAAKRDALCGNGGGMGAKTGLYAIPIRSEDAINNGELLETDGHKYAVYEVENKTISNKAGRRILYY